MNNMPYFSPEVNMEGPKEIWGPKEKWGNFNAEIRALSLSICFLRLCNLYAIMHALAVHF